MNYRNDIDQQPAHEDLQLLAEVSQLLTLLDLDRVIHQVIELMKDAVGATRASLFLQHEQGIDWDHIITTRDLDPEESFQVVQSVLDKGLAGWVVRNRQGAIIFDTATDERWHVFPNDTRQVGSVLCVPFINNDDVVAVLTLEHPDTHRFDERHLRMMTIVANQVTVVVRNAQLFNQVQEEGRRFQAVLQSIPDVLFVMDNDGTVLLVNDAALRFLGIDDTEVLINRPLADLVEIEQALAPVYDIVHDPLEVSDRWDFEAHSATRELDFVVTMSTWHDQNRKTAGYVVIMHDVTTLRTLHRFKSDMLKMASHDLRSPLGLITGYSDMIELDLPPGETPIRDYLAAIRRATDRMSNLLDDLLRVEKIRSSPLELVEQINLGDIVYTVISNMEPAASQKQQTLEAAIELDNLPGIMVDPVLIRQAMENLVSNAIKYTPEGGHIIVKASYDAERFSFVVEDNGIGIPANQIERVFDPFYRAKQAGTEDTPGQGVGLNLVKTIIERHKGEIWVESEVGVGSRFGFWLPMSSRS
ncbi:MAG: GAF domain-containing protein [Chloroflexi bacterium]|nr:MAG: hypothetical protein CUN54_04680 [Phototrophicales bacterium]RMF76176.1 MAG: GAF domain-containing protein [Chloroflexota bacterium]